MLVKTGLTLLLAAAVLGHSKTLPHNTELPCEQFKYDEKHVYNAIQLRLGSGNEKSHKTVNFFLDIGQPKALIGESGLFKNGINCQDATDNSCTFDRTVKTPRFYFAKHLVVSPAQAYFTLDSHKIHLEGHEVKKMSFDLIVEGDSWWMKDWGIIGIAPNGELIQYLTQLYEGPIQFLPLFTLDGKNDYRLRVVLNPLFTAGDVLKKYTLPADSKYNQIPGELRFLSEEWDIPPTDICLNTVEHNIAQFDDSPDRCEAVKKLVCKGEGGGKCTKHNSDFSKAPPLTIKIDGTDFVVQGKDYLYIGDKDIVNCRFGDIGEMRSSGGCVGDSMVGLGQGFFALFPTFFEYHDSKAKQIVILSKVSVPNKMSLAFKVLIVLGVAVLLIGGYLIYKTVAANRKKDEPTYSSV